MKELIIRQLKKYYELLKFGITGVLNTLISMLCYFLLLKLNVYYLLANVISYFVGMTNSYILNRKWVFKSDSSIIKTSIKFCCVNIITLGISTLLLYIFVHNFNFNKAIAQIVTTMIIMVINYLGSKFWTFKTIEE